MLKLTRIFACYVLIYFLTGCAPQGLYYWGEYEDSLYERYIENNSEQAEVYLQVTLQEAISENRRVPPGVYADYGFILYQRGDRNAAIDSFEKEKQLYPESDVLMSKLIKRIKQQNIKKEQNSSTYNGEMQ